MDDLFGSDNDEDQKEVEVALEDVIAQQTFVHLLSSGLRLSQRVAKVDYWSNKADNLPALRYYIVLFYDKDQATTTNGIDSVLLSNKLCEKFNHPSFHPMIIASSWQELQDCLSKQAFDICISLTPLSIDKVSSLQTRSSQCGLIGGGRLLCLQTDKLPPPYPSHHWKHLATHLITQASSSSLSLVIYQKVAVVINETAAIYWTGTRLRLDRERNALDACTIHLSAEERTTSVMSEHHRRQAVRQLTEEGLVILPGLYPGPSPGPSSGPSHGPTAASYHSAAIEDIQRVLAAMREQSIDGQTDILGRMEGGAAGGGAGAVDDDTSEDASSSAIIENYYEMSMREARRCDIRHGRAMGQLLRTNEGKGGEDSRDRGEGGDSKEEDMWAEGEEEIEETGKIFWPHIIKKETTKKPSSSSSKATVAATAADNKPPQILSSTLGPSLRYHPPLLSLLHEVMNPTGQHSQGDWGQWNFEGPGPGYPVPLAIHAPGIVTSFPGCADQAIHADAAHLFTQEACLPPHYLNLFVCLVDQLEGEEYQRQEQVIDEEDGQGQPALPPLQGYAIGQKAFVLGSHSLSISKEIMVENNQQMLEDRLVRPHLAAGDVLIFDTRILHFGLANQITGEKVRDPRYWRPILYTNITKTWYSDPKNWNDRRRLFPKEDKKNKTKEKGEELKEERATKVKLSKDDCCRKEVKI